MSELRATIREDNADVELTLTAPSERALAEEIGSEVDQLFLAGTRPTCLVIDIEYEGTPDA